MVIPGNYHKKWWFLDTNHDLVVWYATDLYSFSLFNLFGPGKRGIITSFSSLGCFICNYFSCFFLPFSHFRQVFSKSLTSGVPFYANFFSPSGSDFFACVYDLPSRFLPEFTVWHGDAGSNEQFGYTIVSRLYPFINHIISTLIIDNNMNISNTNIVTNTTSTSPSIASESSTVTSSNNTTTDNNECSSLSLFIKDQWNIDRDKKMP